MVEWRLAWRGEVGVWRWRMEGGCRMVGARIGWERERKKGARQRGRGRRGVGKPHPIIPPSPPCHEESLGKGTATPHSAKIPDFNDADARPATTAPPHNTRIPRPRDGITTAPHEEQALIIIITRPRHYAFESRSSHLQAATTRDTPSLFHLRFPPFRFPLSHSHPHLQPFSQSTTASQCRPSQRQTSTWTTMSSSSAPA